MSQNKFEKNNRITEKHIFIFLVGFQSLVFLLWLLLGVNPAFMVVFACASLGSTVGVFTLYNRKKLREYHLIGSH